MARAGRIVEIQYLDLLESKLKRIRTSIEWGMGKAMRDSKEFMLKAVPPYPPPPPFSKYVRTFRLKNSINAEVQPMGSTVVMFITADTEYAHWVVDKNKQAGIHRGRWWTLQGVLESTRDGVIKIWQNHVKKWMIG